MKDPITLVHWNQHHNVQAFTWAIRYGEGTAGPDGYRTLFGGGRFKGADGLENTFDDYADHPRILVTQPLGKSGKKITSSAAGIGQFLSRTWDEIAHEWGLRDFTPANQELGMVALYIRRKALDDIVAGRVEEAVRKCNREWASLPGSPYGQPVVSLEQFRSHFIQHGGLENVEPVSLISVPVTQEKVMAAPLLGVLLPSLISAIPDLAKLFSSGSPTSERNIKAVEAVFEVAKEAIGATNEQELIETIQNDPKALNAVREAIQVNWFRLEEVGGGISAARAANTTAQGDRPAWHNPAVWLAGALLPLVYTVVILVLIGDFSDEVKIMVISIILGTGFGGLIAYFWGTSASSAKKDEALVRR